MFPRRELRLITLAAALALCAAARASDGPGMVYAFGDWGYGGGPTGPGVTTGGYTFGWAFTPNTPVTVTALGVADANAPGFVFDHTMFLWDRQTGSVLRSVTAPSGPNPGGVMGGNEFRYYDVTPIELTPGRTYIVGVGFPTAELQAPSDWYYKVELATSVTFDSRITWVDGRVSGLLNAMPNVSNGTGPAGKSRLGPSNIRFAAPPPPACLGDLNNDGAVTTPDLVVFLGRFGRTVLPAGSGADFTADGVVDTADLIRFLGRFGRGCP